MSSKGYQHSYDQPRRRRDLSGDCHQPMGDDKRQQRGGRFVQSLRYGDNMLRQGKVDDPRNSVRLNRRHFDDQGGGDLGRGRLYANEERYSCEKNAYNDRRNKTFYGRRNDRLDERNRWERQGRTYLSERSSSEERSINLSRNRDVLQDTRPNKDDQTHHRKWGNEPIDGYSESPQRRSNWSSRRAQRLNNGLDYRRSIQQRSNVQVNDWSQNRDQAVDQEPYENDRTDWDGRQNDGYGSRRQKEAREGKTEKIGRNAERQVEGYASSYNNTRIPKSPNEQRVSEWNLNSPNQFPTNGTRCLTQSDLPNEGCLELGALGECGEREKKMREEPSSIKRTHHFISEKGHTEADSWANCNYQRNNQVENGNEGRNKDRGRNHEDSWNNHGSEWSGGDEEGEKWKTESSVRSNNEERYQERDCYQGSQRYSKHGDHSNHGPDSRPHEWRNGWPRDSYGVRRQWDSEGFETRYPQDIHGECSNDPQYDRGQPFSSCQTETFDNKLDWNKPSRRNFDNTIGHTNSGLGYNSILSSVFEVAGQLLSRRKMNADELVPFKRDFYIEAPPIQAMTWEAVSQVRDDQEIRIIYPTDPKKVAKPVTSLKYSPFPPKISDILLEKFSYPTPIQQQGWPIALSGKDLIGIAETGSGKTLAFILPALVHIDEQEQIAPLMLGTGPIALVIAPTRELAMQIGDEAAPYAMAMNKSVVTIYGQMSFLDRAKQLCSRIVHIAVATPGKLMNFLSNEWISLSRVTYFVLDEADRLLEMGFHKQITAIDHLIRYDRQILMWSATWPLEVRELVKEVFHQRRVNPPVHIKIGGEGKAVDAVTQNFIYTQAKRLDFFNHMRNTKQLVTLIFANTKQTCNNIVEDLPRHADPDIAAEKLHGDCDQESRTAAIQRFKNKRSQCLVSTDLAARGLDVKNIGQVINYDCPREINHYIHRIGRTGRAGRKGESYTFIQDSDIVNCRDFFANIVSVLEKSNQIVPDWLREVSSRYTEGVNYANPRCNIGNYQFENKQHNKNTISNFINDDPLWSKNEDQPIHNDKVLEQNNSKGWGEITRNLSWGDVPSTNEVCSSGWGNSQHQQHQDGWEESSKNKETISTGWGSSQYCNESPDNDNEEDCYLTNSQKCHAYENIPCITNTNIEINNNLLVKNNSLHDIKTSNSLEETYQVRENNTTHVNQIIEEEIYTVESDLTTASI